MANSVLVGFLVENYREILGVPLSGHLRDLYALFSMNYWSIIQNYEAFERSLMELNQIAPGALTFEKDLLEGERLLDINVFLLRLLYDQINKTTSSVYARENDVDDEVTIVNDEFDKHKDLDRLTSLIDFENDSKKLTYNNCQLPKYLHQKLTSLLETEPMSFKLARERAQKMETVAPYIQVCQDAQHTTELAHIANIVNNKIVSLQFSKLSNSESDRSTLLSCLRTHIHYVPNIKPQTDLSLGDCSYLDTCHKLNTCRYLHYLQYIPESLMNQVNKTTDEINKEQTSHMPLYTHGSCTSTMVKQVLPPQWIRCDVRKFDFKILGKFSVVVADPAWNIHMNLPYGTCNDIELLELPLDELQDEGVLFLWVTGRAIELGKESLRKWGYKVINEISWIKTNQLGRTIVTGRTGHWLNHSKEHLLVGIKGDPQWINKHIDIDLIVSTTRETSRKPDELYGIIERMVGKHARKLEIFGRDHNIRPGWFTVGNQLTGFRIHELDVKARYEAFITHGNGYHMNPMYRQKNNDTALVSRRNEYNRYTTRNK